MALFQRLPLVLSLACLSVAPLAAQDLRFGIKAGVSISDVRFGAASLDIPQQHRFRPGAGVFGVVALSKWIAVQPELLYVEKGTQWRLANGTGGIDLAYIEVPLLARITPWSEQNSRFRPVLLAGATVAHEISCAARTHVSDTEYVIKCSRVDPPGRTPHSFDIGAAAGLGIEFELPTGRMQFDVRYTHGLGSATADYDARNRVWSVSLGYSILVGKAKQSADPTKR